MNQARLKGVPFFGSLSEQDLAAVAEQAEEISVAAGTTIAREGDRHAICHSPGDQHVGLLEARFVGREEDQRTRELAVEANGHAQE